MSTLSVSTVAGLTSALGSAKAGDVIQLAPGNYSGLLIANKTFAGGVTITSANPSNPATLLGLSISNSSGVNFSHVNLSIVGSTDPYYGFRIDSSNNISFSNVDVHGDPSVAAGNQIGGFYVTYSSGITFGNSTFEHMGAAIIANNDTGLTISGNAFTDLNKGGIEMGGSSVVTIANNTFSDFSVTAGTHPDAIQIYTAGTTASAHDIAITGNLIERGTGDAIQGIFVSDDTGSLPFQNLSIQNNVILGGMWDSLYVSNAVGKVQITNNYVASWAGLDNEGNGTDTAALSAPVMTGFAGYIWLQNMSGATLTEAGNTAQSYQSASTPAGNTLIGSINPITTAALPLSSVTAVAQKFTGSGFGQITGNMLTGDSGSGIYAASIMGGNNPYAAVSSTGTTFAGYYGSLTVSTNGAFTYNENIVGTVGVTYDDTFLLTVGSDGQATSTTVDFVLTLTGVGDGKVDYITGGSGASRISGFGATSELTSGVGQDTFVFNNLSQSAPLAQTVIKSFKAGDVIDLSAIDPKLHLVSRLDGGADEVDFAHLGNGNWQIEIDTIGSGTPNFILHLANTATDILNFSGGQVIGGSITTSSVPAVVTAPVVAATTTATAAVATPTVVVSTSSTAATPVSAPAKTASLAEHQTVTGNALTGDTGPGLAIVTATSGSGWQTAVSAGGSTYGGAFGSLILHQDGSYAYAETAENLVAGQVYDDKFTFTVAGTNGSQAVTTLDFLVTGSPTGTGGMNYITGGAAATTISGFGSGSQLTSGAGLDTFVFNSLSQSAPLAQTLIKGFKAGDAIDLSAIDPRFHLVSRLDGGADELVFAHLGNGNWQIEGDTTGSGTPNFIVHLLNTYADSLNLIGGQVIGASAAAPVVTAPVVATTTTATPVVATPAVVAASPSTATTPVTAPAKTASLTEHQTVTGNALTGDTGPGLAIVTATSGSGWQTPVAAAGSTYGGTFGSLILHQDGSYTYAESAENLVAGQVYDDKFTFTVAGTNGSQAVTTLDFLVTGSPTGTGGANYITGGAAATTISGFGMGSQLTSGVGADTFVFNSLSQSTPASQILIKGLKTGDIVDLSAVDPNFHIVSRLDGGADELVIQHLGNGNWQILGDTVGGGTPDFAVHFLNTMVTTLGASSFHL